MLDGERACESNSVSSISNGIPCGKTALFGAGRGREYSEPDVFRTQLSSLMEGNPCVLQVHGLINVDLDIVLIRTVQETLIVERALASQIAWLHRELHSYSHQVTQSLQGLESGFRGTLKIGTRCSGLKGASNSVLRNGLRLLNITLTSPASLTITVTTTESQDH